MVMCSHPPHRIDIGYFDGGAIILAFATMIQSANTEIQLAALRALNALASDTTIAAVIVEVGALPSIYALIGPAVDSQVKAHFLCFSLSSLSLYIYIYVCVCVYKNRVIIR